jgi:ribosome-binding factor A
MGNRRTAKVAEAIREVVSTTILFKLRDPRVQSVTVLGVEVPTDLRTAKVHVSVMGEDRQIRLTMSGLEAARGFIQSQIADQLNLQYTPVLSFALDDGVKRSLEAARILRELAAERGELQETGSDETGSSSEVPLTEDPGSPRRDTDGRAFDG